MLFFLPFVGFSLGRLSGFVEVWVDSFGGGGTRVGKWRGRRRAKRGEESREALDWGMRLQADGQRRLGTVNFLDRRRRDNLTLCSQGWKEARLGFALGWVALAWLLFRWGKGCGVPGRGQEWGADVSGGRGGARVRCGTVNGGEGEVRDDESDGSDGVEWWWMEEERSWVRGVVNGQG